jgi:O-antigen ligase
MVACFVIVMVWPDAGKMNFFPYDGSWRGILWHRNYLGSTMALGVLIFLLCFFLSDFGKRIQAVFYGACYLLSLALVVLSQSATGLILLIVLHFVLVGVALWLKWYPHMRPVHYLIIGALALIALVIGYIKLDLVLGLFNRNSTFTGRASLWAYLFTHVINRRPALGYGFGALWVQQSFQVQLRDAIGWPYPVMIGDNGYVDMILHVGYVGFLAFMLVIVLACWRMARFAFRKRTLIAFVPILLMVYVLLTNFTLSYFLETESLVWIIMVALFFAVTPGRVEDKNITALPD